MLTLRLTVLAALLSTTLPALADTPLGEVADSRGSGQLIASGAVSGLAPGQPGR